MAYLLPALLLLLVLLTRRYPGERALLARADGSHLRTRRHIVEAGACSPRPTTVPPRGGLLIAASLAVRPPPSPSAAQQS